MFPLIVAEPISSPVADPTLISSVLELVDAALTTNSDAPFEKLTFLATKYPPAVIITFCLLGVIFALLSSAAFSASTFV